MEALHLSFEITRRDLEEACRSPHFQKSQPRLLVFGSLLLIASVVKFCTQPLLYNQGFVYLLIAAPLLSFAVFKPKWDAYKAFKQEDDWRISYDIGQMGTTIFWTDVDEPFHKWSEYDQLLETKNLFLLQTGYDGDFQMIPKRAFATETELEQFRAWASQIGRKKRRS